MERRVYMSPLELGLVGAAHIHTPNFIKRILAREDVRVKSVWDHDQSRAERRAAELGATVVSSPDAIWEDGRVCGPGSWLSSARPCQLLRVGSPAPRA